MRITLSNDEVQEILTSHAQSMNLGTPEVTVVNKRTGIEVSIEFTTRVPEKVQTITPLTA